ncbi:hypothetical protein CCPUN_00630 [Cardinium endosymbiont of Culicoides punctatus]|nr:hypothetical protein CCPUN_00630 [Cardinium endosymbiont of Culicoides punctatus]
MFIEIPKFDKRIDNLQNNEERWCAFLRGDVQTEEDSEKVSGHDIYIEKAIDQLKSCNYTEEQMDEYRRDLIQIANQNVTEIQKQELWKKEGKEEAKKEFDQKNKERKRRKISNRIADGLDPDNIKKIFCDDSDYDETEIDNMINEASEDNRTKKPLIEQPEE